MAYPSTTHPATARPYTSHVTIVHQSTANPTTCHPTTTHPSTGHQTTTLLSTCHQPRTQSSFNGICGRRWSVCCFLQEHEKDVWKIMKKIESFLVLFMKLEPKT
ncbi:hypothetical protein YC2023_065045 [Brassica napus]